VLEGLVDEYGWSRGDRRRLNVTPAGPDVPPSLLARIAAGNQADVELFAHARRRVG